MNGHYSSLAGITYRIWRAVWWIRIRECWSLGTIPRFIEYGGYFNER